MFWKRRSKKKNDKICYFPFTQMLLQPTGVVSPCCWNQEYILGQIQNNNILDIWNGEKMRGLRQEFLSGNPVSCSRQMRHVACHKISHRLENHSELTEIQTKGPKRFDLRLNGRCNLKCIMCDVWRQPNGLYNESDFWTVGPTEIFPHLVEMDVLGGEPMIQQDTYRLIREVSAVNQKCSWAFVTNGQYRFGDVVKNHLDMIPIRWIQVSMDSLNPETYSVIRPGTGGLHRVLETLDHLIQYRQERLLEQRYFYLTASMCVQKENWREIPKFLEFTKEKKVQAALQFAYDPATTSLLTLEEVERREVLKMCESLVKRFNMSVLNPVILPMRDSLLKPSLNQDAEISSGL